MAPKVGSNLLTKRPRPSKHVFAPDAHVFGVPPPQPPPPQPPPPPLPPPALVWTRVRRRARVDSCTEAGFDLKKLRTGGGWSHPVGCLPACPALHHRIAIHHLRPQTPLHPYPTILITYTHVAPWSPLTPSQMCGDRPSRPGA